MTSSPAPQARARWTSLLIKQRERAACPQLRVFHRIYETMGLGMHPASLYPRRSRIAPTEECPRVPHSSSVKQDRQTLLCLELPAQYAGKLGYNTSTRPLDVLRIMGKALR